MSSKKLSYKESLSEIENIISSIEKDNLDIDELAEKIKRATSLIKICNAKLHQTEDEVDKILSEI